MVKSMFEELYAPLPDIDTYLDRIGYGKPIKPDVETLNALIMAHLMAIPFENLDVFDYNKEVSLATEDLFDKMVLRRRGGCCFEVNALFYSLLKGLGFECYPLIGRVMWNKDYYPHPGHRATSVIIGDHSLFCDVGYGGPAPCAALYMDDAAIQHTIAGPYSFKKHAGGVMLHKHVDSKAVPMMLLDDRPADPIDFLPLNYFYAKSQLSFLRMKRMANIKTKTGSAAIDGDTLRLRENGNLTERHLATRQERTDALYAHFGIDVQ